MAAVVAGTEAEHHLGRHAPRHRALGGAVGRGVRAEETRQHWRAQAGRQEGWPGVAAIDREGAAAGEDLQRGEVYRISAGQLAG